MWIETRSNQTIVQFPNNGRVDFICYRIRMKRECNGKYALNFRVISMIAIAVSFIHFQSSK